MTERSDGVRISTVMAGGMAAVGIALAAAAAAVGIVMAGRSSSGDGHGTGQANVPATQKAPGRLFLGPQPGRSDPPRPAAF